MWETRPLELRMEKGLKKQFGPVTGAELFGSYLTARKRLVEDVLPQIQAVLPAHSDHGPVHVANVLDIAHALLDGEKKSPLEAVDLYCLSLSILFHDAGNIFGRSEHQKNIAKVYDYCLGSVNNQQKLIVLRIAGAHTGKARDGSFDTLKELEPASNLFAKPVRQLDLAAVLRLADELAEGPQRTSVFMQEQHKYPTESLVHHRYANCVNVQVDKGNERIALTFHFSLGQDGKDGTVDSLEELVEYAYRRILKLDQERRYGAFYSKILAPLKRTTISLNFFIDGEPEDLDLPPLEISDKVVPGEQIRGISERNPLYAFEELRGRLLSAMGRRAK